MPNNAPRKSKAKALTADQMVGKLMELHLRSSDAGVTGEAIQLARKHGFAPSDEAVATWVERVGNRSETTFDQLATALELVEDASDLVDALFSAAVREQKAPPIGRPWMNHVDWTSATEEQRWCFLRFAVEEAVVASLVLGSCQDEQEALALYLEVVLATLIPTPIGRLEWWLNKARNESRIRGTDLDFGSEVQTIASDWANEAMNGDLATLLRLAQCCEEPVWGASMIDARTRQEVYDAIREALPPPGKPSKRPRSPKSS